MMKLKEFLELISIYENIQLKPNPYKDLTTIVKYPTKDVYFQLEAEKMRREWEENG